MKHLTISVPNGENNLSSIVGSYKIFSRANAYQKERGKAPIFKIQLAGISDEINFYDGLFSVKPHTLISKISKTNLVIIPSLNHNYNVAIKDNQEIIDWIVKQHQKGAQLASICTGAFLLAASGLLNGKTCSTHWAAADSFRNLFPQINLKTDQLITDENGIYTNGGAYSFLNLIIYLVEKYYDRQTAVYCSKVFQIEIDPIVNLHFPFLPGKKNTVMKWFKKHRPILKATSMKGFQLKIFQRGLLLEEGILTEGSLRQQAIRHLNMLNV